VLQDLIHAGIATTARVDNPSPCTVQFNLPFHRKLNKGNSPLLFYPFILIFLSKPKSTYMRCTTLVALATLFLASCKTVQIDKQPIKTTVENTPTVNVANFPTSGGTGNVNANVINRTDADAVPVRIINNPQNAKETYGTATGTNSVSVICPAGKTLIIEYVNWVAYSDGASNVRVSLGVTGENLIYFPILQTFGNHPGISDKVYLPVLSGRTATLIGSSGNNATGTATIGYRIVNN
jgi:hypothetical protein